MTGAGSTRLVRPAMACRTSVTGSPVCGVPSRSLRPSGTAPRSGRRFRSPRTPPGRCRERPGRRIISRPARRWPCSRTTGADMRILGWVLFAATCVLFALQGVFLAASTFPMTSYEVLVDHVFPLLGIGAVIGAGVGALIVSRYPRNLVGWLFLVGQLGNVIGLAADAFHLLVVQGVVDSPLAAQVSGYLNDVFGTVVTVTVLSVIFMIVPDGRPLSRRWRLAVGVPVAAQALWWAGTAAQPQGAYLPRAAEEPQGLRETLTEQVLTFAGFLATLLSISLGAVALILRLRRSTGQQRLQLRWISTGAAVLAVTFVVFAVSQLIDPRATPWILPEAT